MKREKKLFIGCFNKSVILTYIGVIFALAGIFILIDLQEAEQMNLVMFCLIISGLCDLFDGFIARKCNRNETQKAFGVQIDTLCDIISFVIFPSILLYKMAFQHHSQMVFTVSIVMIILYVLCGIHRLAWFNILANAGSKTTYYQGVPVTYISFVVPVFYVGIQRIPFLMRNINDIFVILYGVMGFLFVAEFENKKTIRKMVCIFFGRCDCHSGITFYLVVVMVKIYHRDSKKLIEEKEYQEELLIFLYKTVIGRSLLKLFVARPWFSNLRARYQKSPESKKDILPFVKEYHVDISDYNIDHFDSFNDFFTRKRMYGTTTRSNELMAIADSKLSVYRVDEKLKLNIKNSIYELKDIIQQKEIADLYKNGYALVFRLAVNDYHRYVFFDDGELISSEFIKGELHTIRPVSEKYKVYARNSRVVNVMDSKSFGIITQVEIGALLVGKIVNHNTHMFSRLEEKGYFEYGGSTIVMFFPPNIMIDEDILRQSQAGYETQVFIGDKIGQRKE